MIGKEQKRQNKKFMNKNTEKPTQAKNNIAKNTGIGCVVILIIFLLIGLLASEDSNVSNDSIDDNLPVETETPTKITGSHYGFGTFAVATANYGGQIYNCLERGTGDSLVEQLEAFFENVSEAEKPEFYSMKQYNPRMKFVVYEPHWAETVSVMPNACLAELEFKNVKSDTIMGYNGNAPYTIDDVDCRVSYTVSEQSGKFKANIFDVFCKPNASYR